MNTYEYELSQYKRRDYERVAEQERAANRVRRPESRQMFATARRMMRNMQRRTMNDQAERSELERAYR